MCDLASHPEYIPELRAEIDQVLLTEPGQQVRKSSLPKLRKLDSLLLESQRMNPGKKVYHNKIAHANISFAVSLSKPHIAYQALHLCHLNHSY